MKRFLLCVILLGGSFSYADVLQVNAIGTWIGADSCGGCISSLAVSFQYDPTLIPTEAAPILGSIIPGTLQLIGTGFLSDFNTGYVADDSIRFYDPSGNEVDMRQKWLLGILNRVHGYLVLRK